MDGLGIGTWHFSFVKQQIVERHICEGKKQKH